MMILGLKIWSVPWYMLGFAALAFLPRWSWLLSGAFLAIAFGISLIRALAIDDGELAEIGVAILIVLAVGSAAGFLARALVLVGTARNWRFRHPIVVLPMVFAAGITCVLGYIAIR